MPDRGASNLPAFGLSEPDTPEEGPEAMLHVGLDLSRKRVDIHVMNDAGEIVHTWAVLPERDGLRDRASPRETWRAGHAAIESMNGARFVHDDLEMAECASMWQMR